MTKLTISLQERDANVIWHPFTQHGLEPRFPVVMRGEGAWLYLEDGRRIIDAVSSWWVNLHGHSHPFIAKAIYDQAQQLEHALFARFTHQPGIMLAEQLVQAAQQEGATLTRCFYSDNGSTAVEVALKIAFQYFKNQGIHTRTRFIALTNAYHGDTLGAMAVGERSGFSRHFAELFPQVDFINSGDTAALAQLLQSNAHHYAAVIVEPLVQGAAGMRMYTPEFLSAVAVLCRQKNTLLICDEVFTGFYRTGTCFAFSQAKIQPDLLCLAKGISGGFLPLAVTLATEKIFNTFRTADMQKAFLHGHSYTASPVACAAALASWTLLQQAETQAAIQEIVKKTHNWIKHLAAYPQVADARCLGTIGAIELRNFPDYFAGVGHKIAAYALERGVLLRPLGPVLYALPPYCITASDLDHIYQVIEAIVEDYEIFLK